MGLEPLCGSTVLQQIDLSLAKVGQKPDINPEPKISEHQVVPILNSIINARNNSLRHLQLPKKWRAKRPPDDQLDSFLEKYEEVRENRRESCPKCDEEFGRGEHLRWEHGFIHTMSCEWYGLHNNTCYSCLSLFCTSESCADIDEENDVQFCNICERDHCQRCNENAICPKCESVELCSDCARLQSCQACNELYCINCASSPKKCGCSSLCKECAPSYLECENTGCNQVCCVVCSGDDVL